MKTVILMALSTLLGVGLTVMLFRGVDDTVLSVSTLLNTAAMPDQSQVTLEVQPEVLQTEPASVDVQAAAAITTDHDSQEPPEMLDQPSRRTVDYAQLNRDLQNITQTLDRFNQKLLKHVAMSRESEPAG